MVWVYDIFPYKLFVSPNLTCVIFWARDYIIALVVERARKDFVFMTIKDLLFSARICVPHSTSPIARCSDNFIPLRIELDFGYFVLVALEKCCTCTSEYIIDSRNTVGWCSGKLVTSAVKCGIQDLIIMSPEGLNTFSTGDIPQFACSINRSSEAILSRKVKLAAW